MIKMNLFSLVFGLSLIILGHSGPSKYYTKCSKSDSSCLVTQALVSLPLFAAGISEYGVKTMDPMHIKKIDASNDALKLLITDVTVTGLQNCKPKQIEFIDAGKLHITFDCTADLNGHYEMDGRILILPLKGQGKLEVNLKKAFLDITLALAQTEKNGKAYYNVKSFQHTFELKDKSNVHFENLFDGNKELGRAASEALSASSNEIIYEVGPSVIKNVIEVVVKNINRFFHTVPIEEIINE